MEAENIVTDLDIILDQKLGMTGDKKRGFGINQK